MKIQIMPKKKKNPKLSQDVRFSLYAYMILVFESDVSFQRPRHPTKIKSRRHYKNEERYDTIFKKCFLLSLSLQNNLFREKKI